MHIYWSLKTNTNIRGRQNTRDATQGDNVLIDYTYDNNGNLITTVDDSGTTVKTFDSLNRIVTESVPVIGTKTYSYDITDNVDIGYVMVDMTDPFGNVTSKIYDKCGRLSSVQDAENAQLTTYEYYANGAVRKIINIDGTYTTYVYNGDNTISEMINYAVDGTVIDKFIYTYDAAKNQLSKTEYISGDAKGTTYYSYDAANRLKAVTEPDGKLTEYEYDKAGNRVIKRVLSNDVTETVCYTYNEQERLITEVSISVKDSGSIKKTVNYTYDNNGNLYSKVCGTIHPRENEQTTNYSVLIGDDAELDMLSIYQYDVFNRLTKVYYADTISEYVYNADGLRVVQKNNDEIIRYMYDGGYVIAETNEQGNLTARNVYGIRLITRTANGEDYIYRFNGHGDVIAVVDENGIAVASYTYDPFGVQLTFTDTIDNPYRYCGEYQDLCSGLIYLRNRYYDPTTGRFISEDPIMDGLNWYVYCGNNPVNYIDPLGLWMTGDEKLPQWAQDTITAYTAMWDSAKNNSERNTAHQGAEAVRIFVATYYQSRSDWGAGMSNGSMDSITGTRADYYNKLTYHHTNRPQYESMKSLQQAEQAGGEYSDVPYHFVIDGNGTVYEGRSLQYMGAHVYHDNVGNIGLALMGNFEENASLWQKFKDSIQGASFSNPTSVQVNNAKQLATFLDVAYDLPTIGGHRSFADGYTTDCPGSRLTELLSPTYKNVYFWRSAGGK